MKTTQWLLIVLLSGIPLHALQGATPQAALEEIATTTKPEILARHLPEPVQKRIEDLPKPQKQRVMEQLLEIKSTQLGGCTLKPAHDSEGWEIFDGDGNSKGKVKLADAFISGTNALLPLEIQLEDGPQSFIVTMHLEDDEWRIDNFGPWEKNDLGLEKLLHEPTEMEKNEAAARETLQTLNQQLYQYSRLFPRIGFPSSLRVLTEPSKLPPIPGLNPLLDESFAADPLIKNGYIFRYRHTGVGSGGADSAREWQDQNDPGTFEITATPVEFGKTGAKNYFINQRGSIHEAAENRPATEDDPVK